jgi:DNA-binding MarR family transcriptional regulator
MAEGSARRDAIIYAAEYTAVFNEVMAESTRKIRRANLTPQQYRALLLIEGAPDGSASMRLAELGRRLATPQSSTSELVSRMEQSGLILRVWTDGDTRAVIKLTEEGRRRFESCFAALDDERARTLHAMETLVRMLLHDGAASGTPARSEPSRPSL